MFESLVNGLMAKAAESNKPEQGDYLVDDLWYCGHCNTPKQTRVEVFGQIRTPMCLCKCRAEKLKEEERRGARERNRAECFSEAEMRYWTFENADGSNAKNMEAMKRYAENFERFLNEGRGLLLFGTVGTGKTYAAACIANAVIEKDYTAHMTNFARIADAVSGMFDGKQKYFDNLNRFPLLALDDLSAERKTEYMQEIVFKVIDSRYRAGLPLIVTTNLSWQELTNPQDISNQRIYSRLLEMCIPVKFEGADKRLEKLRDSMASSRNLLGL